MRRSSGGPVGHRAHAKRTSTQFYTHVVIGKLIDVYLRTHPSAAKDARPSDAKADPKAELMAARRKSTPRTKISLAGAAG